MAGLIVLLVLVACCGLGDGALAALRVRADSQAPSAYFFGDADTGTAGLTALLNRRAAAVLQHDQAAFLADVDQSDPSFVRREREEYQNLTLLGLTSFTLTPQSLTGYPVPSDEAVLVRRYSGAAWAVSVTIRYAVSGLDSAPVAEPWVPIFGFSAGRWVLAGESDDSKLPTGAGGLPWEGGPIVVKHSTHVVAVVTSNDQEIAPHLLTLAERGLIEVFKLRPDGWGGKVLMTAVANLDVFHSYFRDSPDKVRQVAAIAVPTYDAVPEWDSDATFVTTRVVFNPETLGDGDEELVHDLAHEFTHAAMGPLTSAGTPLWLVEGIAEYVGYRTGRVDNLAIGGVMRQIGVPDALPGDDTFYDSADNYVLAWLACKMIADKYGQAKLLALYGYFHDHPADAQDTALHQVLGPTLAQFTAAWRGYLKNLIG